MSEVLICLEVCRTIQFSSAEFRLRGVKLVQVLSVFKDIFVNILPTKHMKTCLLFMLKVIDTLFIIYEHPKSVTISGQELSLLSQHLFCLSFAFLGYITQQKHFYMACFYEIQYYLFKSTLKWPGSQIPIP